MENEQHTGGRIDPRSTVERMQDWPERETGLASATSLVWNIINLKDLVDPYPPRRYQKTSSSCMQQSGATVAGVENVPEGGFVVLSAAPGYRSRSNFPGEGMYLQETLASFCKPYACREDQFPSQNMTEAEMNAVPTTLTADQKQTAEFYRAGGYFMLDLEFDKLAGIIAQGKAVEMILFFLKEEYWKNVPEVVEKNLTNDPNDARIQRHGVAGVKYGLYKGKKAIVIKDSSGPSSSIEIDGEPSGLRIITEDFFNKRCYGAGYLAFRKNEAGVTPKPRHTFKMPLWYGLMNNTDVVALQDILKYEGFFDLNTPSTGNMLQMTCSALRKSQMSNGINDFANEPDVRKVRFGPKSIALYNSLYGN